MTDPLAIVVRRARAEDLPAILAIERVSFTDPWSRGSFAALLEQPRVHFAVALDGDGGALLGYTVAWFVVDEAELANLAVTPEARGKGIGALLLKGAIEASDARGSEAMYLEVRASNQSAIALYTAHGFSEVGRRRSYYRRPVEDALILRRTVTRHPDTTHDTQRK
jgi:[ribosomal protein S18]-alanine N-acetyltransferase